MKPNKKIRKGFDTALMFALKFDNAAIEQVISIVTAAFVLIAYIVGEGVVDASNKDKED